MNSSMLEDVDLATPGNGGIELTDIRGNVREDSFSAEGTRHSIVNMNFSRDISESSEASIQVYEKNHTTPVEFATPDGITGGGHAGESSNEEPITGGLAVEQWVDDYKEFSDLDEEMDKIQKSDIGDCYYCWKHKKCCCFFVVFLVLFLLACFIILPRPLHLCVTFSFDDKNAIDRVPGDEGHFDLTITNPNYIPVSIHEFEINAYYGGVAEKREVINVARSDYSIGAKNTLKTNNKTYVYAENLAGTVPIAALDGCSMGARADMTYDLVASFKGCLMPFLCKSGIVLEKSYVNSCLKDDDWMCTDFEILG